MGGKSPAGCTRPTGVRLLVEGTIGLVVFSLFLEIKALLNYAIFVLIWYALLGLIIWWQTSHLYCFEGGELEIRSFTSRKRVRLANLREAFVSQGPIAKRLGVGSVYIVMENGKVIVIMDVKDPEKVLERVNSGTG
ncbi:MAG: hypothetical protein ASUL_08214 [Candidatus Aramenus sulfurataquae]|uniref:YdbS-like PH domain-containing protein n=1 Tax=Candidatus Aramenus sulfurataquae TaxID=1326980 RepID=W7KVQ5_9CREN|nr:MAG: hypothetical protein ASUL_08214 [Candidatus Aramenus sulfurataquae]